MDHLGATYLKVYTVQVELAWNQAQVDLGSH